jgi:predicted double-glycine peptidase
MKVSQIYKKHKLHIQQTGYSCGPCAILNILNQKKKRGLSEKGLMKLCKAKPGIGCDYKDIKRVVNEVGLKIIEEKSNGKIRDIERNIKKGCFVLVLYYHLYADIGHYAVITEYDKKAFYFIDSSYGFLRLKKKDFAKYWYNTNKKIHRWFLSIK